MEWSPETDPHMYGQLPFDKEAKDVQGEWQPLPHAVLGELGTHVTRGPSSSYVNEWTEMQE